MIESKNKYLNYVGKIIYLQKLNFSINNDDWKFEFKRREDIRIIEEMIKNIYYLQSQYFFLRNE